MLATQRRRIIRSMLAIATIAAGVVASGDAHAAGTAGTCGVITYCGGPVISNVQIQPVSGAARCARASRASPRGT